MASENVASNWHGLSSPNKQILQVAMENVAKIHENPPFLDVFPMENLRKSSKKQMIFHIFPRIPRGQPSERKNLPRSSQNFL